MVGFSYSDPKTSDHRLAEFSIHETTLPTEKRRRLIQHRAASLEETMFLCQPLLEAFAGRGIEDIDAFLKVPSWNDLPDPFSIPSIEKATARVLCAVRRPRTITTSMATTIATGSSEPTSYAAC